MHLQAQQKIKGYPEAHEVHEGVLNILHELHGKTKKWALYVF